MAHTAKYLEGALYEIITANLITFGVNILDAFDSPAVPQKILSVGPADRLTARMRFGTTEFYRINTSAALTAIQVIHFEIEVWGRIVDSTAVGAQLIVIDNIGGTVARIWQLIAGMTEAANVGDVGWNNIAAVKVLYTSAVDYTNFKIPHRILYCAATWN